MISSCGRSRRSDGPEFHSAPCARPSDFARAKPRSVSRFASADPNSAASPTPRLERIDMKRIRRLAQKFGLGRGVCVLLLFALAGLRIWDPLPLEELRLRTFDTYQKLAPRPVMPSPPAVVSDIDEQSLSAFGQWPWPRTLVADLVTRLTKLGVAAVAFDIIFAEPDRVSPGRMAGALPDLDEETREKLRRLPSNDQVLATAMRQSRVVLGQSL